jgi:hypothetical protein
MRETFARLVPGATLEFADKSRMNRVQVALFARPLPRARGSFYLPFRPPCTSTLAPIALAPVLEIGPHVQVNSRP